MSGRRIVSLLPSTTEIVAALDGLDRLVGRSHECDHPPGVEALPVCCRPRIDINAAGHEIDRQVKQRLAEAISIFEIDHRQLSELQPDLILTQDQCEVCAVTIRFVTAKFYGEIRACGACVKRNDCGPLKPGKAAEPGEVRSCSSDLSSWSKIATQPTDDSWKDDVADPLEVSDVKLMANAEEDKVRLTAEDSFQARKDAAAMWMRALTVVASWGRQETSLAAVYKQYGRSLRKRGLCLEVLQMPDSRAHKFLCEALSDLTGVNVRHVGGEGVPEPMVCFMCGTQVSEEAPEAGCMTCLMDLCADCGRGRRPPCPCVDEAGLEAVDLGDLRAIHERLVRMRCVLRQACKDCQAPLIPERTCQKCGERVCKCIFVAHHQGCACDRGERAAMTSLEEVSARLNLQTPALRKQMMSVMSVQSYTANWACADPKCGKNGAFPSPCCGENLCASTIQHGGRCRCGPRVGSYRGFAVGGGAGDEEESHMLDMSHRARRCGREPAGGLR